MKKHTFQFEGKKGEKVNKIQNKFNNILIKNFVFKPGYIKEISRNIKKMKKLQNNI